MTAMGGAGAYWARRDTRGRWGSLLVVGLLATLGCAVALASVAGARRTYSSYARLVEAEGAPHVLLFTQEPLTESEVERFRAIGGGRAALFEIAILDALAMGVPRGNDLGLILPYADADLRVQRHVHLDGALPALGATNEVLVNEALADALALAPGDPLGIRPLSFEAIDGCFERGQCDIAPQPPVTVEVSGVSRLSGDLTTDAFNSTLMFGTAAMRDSLPEPFARVTTVVQVTLDGGPASADDYLAAVDRVFPGRFGSEVSPDPYNASINGALRVEAGSLVIFGALALVAGAVAAWQAFARHLAAAADDRDVLRAVGLTRVERMGAGWLPGVAVAAVSTLTAVTVAVLVSPLLPVGRARAAEPDPGFDVDALVLAVGGLAVFGLLVAGMAGLAWRAARPVAPSIPAKVSWLTRATPGRVGLRWSLGTRTAPTRSALVSVMAATALTAAAIVITASNHDLQRTPSLHGQPWDAYMSASPAIVEQLADPALAHPDVAAVARVTSGEVALSGDAGDVVAVVGFDSLRGSIDPVVLEGRPPRAPDEIALGATTLRSLDLSVGDELPTPNGTLHVVGRAIVPIVDTDSPNEGGVLTADGLDRFAELGLQGEVESAGVAFTVREGVDVDALLEDDLGPAAARFGVKARVTSDVRNLSGIGRFPAALAALAAVLAAIGVVHTLHVIARARRRDIATLQAIGARRSSCARIMPTIALCLVVAGLLVGVPLGIATGRLIWQAIASFADVLERQTVNPNTLAGLIAAAMLLGLVAAVPSALRVRRQRLTQALRNE